MRAKDVANAFIGIFKDEDEGITNLKLQKLLYYAQGFSYQRFGHELFDDEIEAWKDGPVVYDVYKRYRSCGRSPIRVCDDVYMSEEEERLIIDVARQYGQYTTTKLVDMTHKEGTPWRDIYTHGVMRNEIPKSLIKAFFSEKETTLESIDIEDFLRDAKVVDCTKGERLSATEWVYE